MSEQNSLVNHLNNPQDNNEIISEDVQSRLKNALKSAINNENYELAARIRDKIISIDQK